LAFAPRVENNSKCKLHQRRIQFNSEDVLARLGIDVRLVTQAPVAEFVTAPGEIVYDPTRVTYEQLLARFWRTTDPTAKNRQFCDVGTPYRHAIFAHGDEQLTAARKSLAELEKSKPFAAPIVTEIVEPAGGH